MKTIKIALTGGPRGGKTSIVNEMKKRYENSDNVNFMFIPETATELADNLVKPNEVSYPFNFQTSVFERQVFKEEEAKKILTYNSKDTNLILCDRGILDNKAYLQNQKEFDFLLSMYGRKELDLADEYDLVIHLMSSSINDELEYELESNKVRYEDRNAAAQLDEKTRNAWLINRNLIMVKPYNDFNDKINKVVRYIDDAIMDKKTNNYDYYRVDNIDSILSTLSDENSKKIEVNKVYLCNTNIKLMKRTYKNFTSYFIMDDNSRDKRIDHNKYLELISKYGVNHEISYTEVSFFDDINLCRLNIYGDKAALMVDSKVSAPLNVDVLDKIDDIEEFTNKNSAKILKKYK